MWRDKKRQQRDFENLEHTDCKIGFWGEKNRDRNDEGTWEKSEENGSKDFEILSQKRFPEEIRKWTPWPWGGL